MDLFECSIALPVATPQAVSVEKAVADEPAGNKFQKVVVRYMNIS
jgi:hypothetical protein